MTVQLPSNRRLLVTICIATLVVLAGCSNGSVGGDGNGSGPGDGSVADESAGQLGGELSEGEWQSFGFDREATYTYDVYMEAEGSGTLVWDVTDVTDDGATVSLAYDVGETSYESTVTGSRSDIQGQLLYSPAGSFLLLSVFSPTMAYYERGTLTVGNEWSVRTPDGSVRTAVTGTDTYVGVECFAGMMEVDGSHVTFDAATTITSGAVEYEATGLTDGSSHSLDVTVADDAGNVRTETVSFSVGSGGSGGFPGLPPVGDDGEIRVTDLAVSPASVAPGEPVTLTASLENTGDESASRLVEFRSDGTVFDEAVVTVAGGATETVVATHAFDEPGTYALSVDGLESIVEVSDDGSDDDSPDDGSDDGTADSPTEPEDDDGNTDGLPGFGPLAALLAIAVAAVGRIRLR